MINLGSRWYPALLSFAGRRCLYEKNLKAGCWESVLKPMPPFFETLTQ